MSGEFVLPRRRRRIKPYLDLTAMIDTVFNLLIFFAVTMTWAGTRVGLPLHLPSAQTAQPVPERVVVMLAVNQPLQVNGVAVSLDELGPALDAAADGNLDTQIVVMADRDVSYARLVAVLDRARRASFTRIALAASPEKVTRAREAIPVQR